MPWMHDDIQQVSNTNELLLINTVLIIILIVMLIYMYLKFTEKVSKLEKDLEQIRNETEYIRKKFDEI